MKLTPTSKIIVVVGLVATASYIGFANKRSRSVPGTVRELDTYIDLSDKTEGVILREADQAYRLQRDLSPDVRVKVYVFAHGLEKIYDDPPQGDRGHFNDKVSARLIHPTKELSVPDTHTEVVLQEIAHNIPTTNTAIAILTDGGIEQLTPTVNDSITESIEKLKSAKAVKRLAVLDVQQEFRRQWDQWLKPLGAQRGIVKGTDDADSVIDQIEEDGQ